jgi:hypothetical protein
MIVCSTHHHAPHAVAVHRPDPGLAWPGRAGGARRGRRLRLRRTRRRGAGGRIPGLRRMDPAGAADARRSRRPDRPVVARDRVRRHHRARRQHRGDPHHARGAGLSGDRRQARRGTAGAGVGGRRHRAELGAEDRLRPAAARSRGASGRRAHAQFPQRTRHGVRRHLSHPRRPARPDPGAQGPQGLCPRRRRGADAADRREPGVSRRALAHRRGRRLVRRHGLGHRLLGHRHLAAGGGQDRAGG